jgi:hypothetical protein
MGIFPNAWTASVCMSAPASEHRAAIAGRLHPNLVIHLHHGNHRRMLAQRLDQCVQLTRLSTGRMRSSSQLFTA